MEYPKIETLFVRDEKFNVTDKLRMPVVATINKWQVTEKIDGTNIRVMLSLDGELSFTGRTSRAQLPADLFTYLQKTFTVEKMKDVFWLPDKTTGEIKPASVVLYAEGYGAGIQKGGGDYNREKRVRLFDVLVGGRWWLDWENTCDVAKKLEIKTVPYLGDMSLEEIIEFVKTGFDSIVAAEEGKIRPAEGIVGRTIEPLFDKQGRRLIIKLKTGDFVKEIDLFELKKELEEMAK